MRSTCEEWFTFVFVADHENHEYFYGSEWRKALSIYGPLENRSQSIRHHRMTNRLPPYQWNLNDRAMCYRYAFHIFILERNGAVAKERLRFQVDSRRGKPSGTRRIARPVGLVTYLAWSCSSLDMRNRIESIFRLRLKSKSEGEAGSFVRVGSDDGIPSLTNDLLPGDTPSVFQQHLGVSIESLPHH